MGKINFILSELIMTSSNGGRYRGSPSLTVKSIKDFMVEVRILVLGLEGREPEVLEELSRVEWVERGDNLIFYFPFLPYLPHLVEEEEEEE